jgi:hypothetical protein
VVNIEWDIDTNSYSITELSLQNVLDILAGLQPFDGDSKNTYFDLLVAWKRV